MSHIIEFDQVWKIFGAGESETIALQNVDLTVETGEFVSIIGPSGCGKSTLLRLIADLLPPSKGDIRVNGKTPRQARLDRDYGMVFQAPTLYEWRTVLKNVELPLEVMRSAREDKRGRAVKMLDLVGLSDFQNHYPRQLSGGMQQRVSIARALVFEPTLILMDEPFGALDEFTRERLNLELLDIWAETHKTVIFVTHSISEAVFLSSRVVVMTPRPGKIARIIDIDLSYPRNFETRESDRFFELVTEVRETLKEEFTRGEIDD
ncbi:MAG: ABC transporter ATP-binding protein [Caldilineaceae bacterium]|nr:ABC transporter ATP-binding protein [Caldilineaceae bacterium]MCB9136960.1 ABC transporter ATP-binding protein [Caldilineaceae bacterium]